MQNEAFISESTDMILLPQTLMVIIVWRSPYLYSLPCCIFHSHCILLQLHLYVFYTVLVSGPFIIVPYRREAHSKISLSLVKLIVEDVLDYCLTLVHNNLFMTDGIIITEFYVQHTYCL